MRETRGDLLCFLNDDVEPLDDEWLVEMAARATSPGAGAVGARLQYRDGTVQHAGIVVGLYGVASHLFRGLPPDHPGDALGRTMVARGVSALSAACLLVGRDAFLAAGGFDESLAVAFNDVDLCLRLRARGLRNVYTPHARLVHDEGRSRGSDDSPRNRARWHREERILRNRWRTDRFEDPFHSPNLSLRSFSATLAWPPRN